MNFSFCAISRNEEKTLPRLIASLQPFQAQGGVCVLVDTGSTDRTAQIAREAGWVVEEVGGRFTHLVEESLFLEGVDTPIVQSGDTYFDFAEARNYAASLCPTDMVSCIDCDEEVTTMNLPQISALIDAGYTQFEYNFVFAHREDGSPALEFTQSKFYDRRVLQWVGMVHEVLEGEGKRCFLDPTVFQIDHWQNFETNRHSYLTGLAIDCVRHPEKDRNSHYYARELFWAGYTHAALKEFQRHVDMNKWPAERAQSLIFIGDCYGQLDMPDEQVAAYSRAFQVDSTRRESLIKLARFYQYNNDALAANAYATASLEIPEHAFYANNKDHYEHEPHEILYWAKGWLGDIEGAKTHLLKALSYRPSCPQYLADKKYYFGETLPTISFVIPTLGRPEGLKRCLDSITALEYPKELIEVWCQEDVEHIGVPKMVKRGVEEVTGDWIIYGSNDVEFTPACIREALKCAGKRLIALNTGEVLPDEGNICEHFMIKRDLIPELGGEVFDTEFHHTGVDNLLWEKAKRLHEAVRCEQAVVHHYHFSHGAEMDDVYTLGWSHVEEDRALLKKKLALLNTTSDGN